MCSRSRLSPRTNWRLKMARYIFYRGNPKGRFQERWVHQQGCRRWFNLVRDTVTHEIAGSYLPGQEPPA